jgi:hypothetical protein
MEQITVLDLNKTTTTVVGKLLNLKRTDETVKKVIEKAKENLKKELENSKNKGEDNLKIVNWIKENYKEPEEKLSVDEKNRKTNAKKYVQQEIDGMKKRGGWRGGGRPKSTGQTTVAIRIDKRLEETVNKLKEQLKNGTFSDDEKEEKKDVIKIEDLKKLLEKTKREHEERYFNSTGEEKIKNYAMATAITHFDIFLDIFIKNNC